MKLVKKLNASGVIVLVVSIVIVVIIESVNIPLIRGILGIIILVVIPGFFTYHVMFPSPLGRNLPYVIVVVLVLGIIETIIVSYILNFIQSGINIKSILYSQLVLIIFTWATALSRGGKFEGNWSETLRTRPRLSTINRLQGLDMLLTAILIVSFGFFVVVLVYGIYSPGPLERYTEFYVLNQNGEFGNYGSNLDINDELNIIVVVENHEFENKVYRIEAINGSDKIEIGESKVLDGEVWSLKVSLPLNDPNIVILLFKENDPEPYRFLHLNIGL